MSKTSEYVKKPTISNLSKKYGVSRQAIYSFLKQKQLKVIDGVIDDEMIVALEERYGGVKESRKKSNANIKRANYKASVKSNTKVESSTIEKLTDKEISTAKERLINAKQEYNFNKMLITQLQNEISEHQKLASGTTTTGHNQVQQILPQIPNMEKYIKLNLSLSKTIHELELYLQVDDEEDDPFG